MKTRKGRRWRRCWIWSDRSRTGWRRTGLIRRRFSFSCNWSIPYPSWRRMWAMTSARTPMWMRSCPKWYRVCGRSSRFRNSLWFACWHSLESFHSSVGICTMRWKCFCRRRNSRTRRRISSASCACIGILDSASSCWRTSPMLNRNSLRCLSWHGLPIIRMPSWRHMMNLVSFSIMAVNCSSRSDCICGCARISRSTPNRKYARRLLIISIRYSAMKKKRILWESIVRFEWVESRWIQRRWIKMRKRIRRRRRSRIEGLLPLLLQLQAERDRV